MKKNTFLRTIRSWTGLILVGCSLVSGCAAGFAWAQNPETTEADLMVKKKAAMQHFQLAKNFHIRRLYRSAIQEYQKALALNPNWDEARRDLGWAQEDLTLSEQKSALQKSPADIRQTAQEYYTRGQRLEVEDELVEAAQAYKHALALIANYPEAKQALALVQVKIRQALVPNANTFRKRRLAEENEMVQWQKHSGPSPSGAIIKSRVFTPAAATLAPSNTTSQSPVAQAIQTHFSNGSQAFDNENWDLAIQEFQLVLEFMPKYKNASFKLSLAKQHKADAFRAAEQRVEIAADPLEKVKAVRDLAAMDPANPGNLQKWEKTKKDNPELAEKLYHQGVERYARGEYQEALQNWQLVLDLNPDHKKALDSIKKVREKLQLISDQK